MYYGYIYYSAVVKAFLFVDANTIRCLKIINTILYFSLLKLYYNFLPVLPFE